jgi:hypothetical protein
MAPLDPFYFFVLVALFFAYFLYQRIKEYQKYKERIYLLQSIMLVFMIASALLISQVQYVLYGAFFFLLALIMSIVLLFFMGKETTIANERREKSEKTKDPLTRFLNSLLTHGFTGKVAHFLVMFLLFIGAYLILWMLFPILINPIDAIMLSLVISLLFTKMAIDKANSKK